ncbi:uncharacterized protein B0P05DRAFT_587224 [Gilbertella persicaria]|uniref:Protein YTP1-like C-terminal domain-containing protein n=1 Tax=Rhizopus stolonifer TaxID=4846 RepID=A0A367KJK5_RHIST|nr:uncharacterized protein B0P05DRAFT_587224 [Gilbertella persicaria]KAI8078992.1 hypothetical protein B0P05DRAFT_587224 [Gilbertella persicaria]RCI02032.1 hypothetical protein CU098_011316 [Rhizopus stolonifer]
MLSFISCALLLFAPTALAQHDHASMMGDEPVPAFNATGNEPMSYALFPAEKGYFYIHVAMMVIAFWILMPIGVMLGIAKSSLHVPVQLLSFCFAMVGFFFAKLYGHSTPHLYAGNSHHTLGWILFLFMIVQMTVGVVRKIANAVGKHNQYKRVDEEEEHFLPDSPSTSSSSHSQHSDLQSETSGETLHMNEFDFGKHSRSTSFDTDHPSNMSSQNSAQTVTMHMFNAVSPYIPNFIKNAFVNLAYNRFTTVVCRYYHMVMGRTFIVLIFVQTLSGLVVYHGVCRSWEVLGCIAHLIKGGIFFFYGIGTFGRYLGAFANRGWAWNRVENGSSFSFEMIECSLIFIYGITNTWMEHFGQDSRWTHKDLEHASLAFMWWWCGLIGILVESRALRRLLERTVLQTNNLDKKDGYSLNPFPAITVLMTGVSMGNHHQDTQYSSNVHYMWGLLLSFAALCRFMTYITLYRNQPQDAQPSRPPSELLGAFLLICGSILFMASNSGTILWLRRNNVDSMFLMNVCVALTSITLCYVAAMQIIKAWAEKREASKKASY